MQILYLALTLVIVAVAAWVLNARVTMPPNIKPLMNVVLGLIVVGIVLWLINTYVPMAGSIKDILNIVVVLAAIVWVLQAFGLWGSVVGLGRNLRTRMTHPRDPVART
ncbi:MAG: Thivi_2564 family membrane protein [Bryobacteraceae bacterium]|jgi:hypothetical protein